MSLGNKAVRTHAIPFISEPISLSADDYGYYRLTTPEFLTPPLQTVAMPMSRPDKGDVVEAYLFMQMTAPSDQALGIKIGIGTFTDDGAGLIIIPNTIYSEGKITEMQKILTGSEASLSAAAGTQLTVDVDLTILIDHRGDSTYLADAFCLLVTFDSIPSSDNGYALDKFNLSCTAQMGFGT